MYKNSADIIMKIPFKHTLLASLALSLLCACSQKQAILNDGVVIADNDFRLTRPVKTHIPENIQDTSKHLDILPRTLVMSSGDKIDINIQGGKQFSGLFTIDIDGYLKLPYLQPIFANGLTINEITQRLRTTLEMENIFKPEFLNVSLTPVQWSSAFINIKGAVYKPGSIIINERNFKNENQQVTSSTGDFADKRLLSSALKAAGGIRPDADLSRIQLIRKDKTYIIDLRAVMTGDIIINDPVLTMGDSIIVPSVGYLQKELFKISRITPPGFRIFLSNLTVPAASNNASAVGKYSSNLPIGSRLLTAAISANCVGGTQSVNAKRQVVLAGNDPRTNMIRITHKSIEELFAAPNADNVNPFLLPNDHIACFDSTVTNWRDIGRALSDILSPIKVLGGSL